MRSLFHGSNIRPSAPRNTPGYRRLGWCMALMVCTAWANPLAMAQPAASVVAWPRARATPQLALQDTAGRSWQLADQRGKVLVLNFWATWCEPCQAEMPALQKLPLRYGAEHLQVWAINYKEPPSKVAHFQQQWQLNMPVLLDTDGQAAGQWTRRIFPTTVLVDARGQARWVVTGEFDWNSRQAQELLSPLLAAARVPSTKKP